ncbi:MAG: JAB domain-containing protein [Bacteroidota bacterium]
MNVQIPKGSSERIKHPDQLVEIMQRVLLRENKIGRNQEHFWVVGLDNASKLLFIELIGLGRSNRVHADAPTIFRMSIYKMATRVIFVHNHPSGVVKASEGDVDMTIHQYQAGKMLNIEVCDHIIISETDFFSFENEGLMDEIRVSDRYTILDKEQQILQEFKMDAEKEKAAKKEKLDIAKKMKKEGFDEGMIKKMTGLKVGEIREL